MCHLSRGIAVDPPHGGGRRDSRLHAGGVRGPKNNGSGIVKPVNSARGLLFLAIVVSAQLAGGLLLVSDLLDGAWEIAGETWWVFLVCIFPWASLGPATSRSARRRNCAKPATSPGPLSNPIRKPGERHGDGQHPFPAGATQRASSGGTQEVERGGAWPAGYSFIGTCPAAHAFMTGSMMRQDSSASSPRMNSIGSLCSIWRIRWA